MKKQIIIDYEEYLEMKQQYEAMKELLIKIYYSNTTNKEIKQEIEKAKNTYMWWI